MNLIFGIILGLLILTFLVGIHELGHALAAKKNGVKLEEFGLGFPPNVFKFETKTDKILPKGTPIAINWIPLGGYVKLQGEHDSDSKKGDYGAASFWGKTQILFAGVAMNWLVAIVLFAVLAGFFGLPKILPNQFYFENDAMISGGEVIVTKIVEGLPAEKAGLERGDQIISINDEKVELNEDIAKFAKKNAGKTVEVKVIRNGEELSKTVAIRSKNEDGKGLLGVASDSNPQKIHATWSAPIVGLMTTVQLSAKTFEALGELAVNSVTGFVQKFSSNQEVQEVADKKLESAGESMAGPLSILGVLFPMAAEAGVSTIILLTALISLSLACMNVLPIPVLDGGRWLMLFVSRKIFKKVLSKEQEERIISYGVWVMLGLTAIVFVLDILRIF